MKRTFGIVLFVATLFAAFALAAQTPGVFVDSTTADAQNYYNSPQNQIYVDPVTKKVYLGYTWSDQPDWSTFTARVNNVTDHVIADMPTAAASGYGLPDIHKYTDGTLLVGAVSGAQGWFYWPDWANGVTLFKESGVGTAEYDSLNWFDENPAGGPKTNLSCWLQVDEDGTIHWLTYDGWGYIFLYKNSINEGLSFEPAVIVGGSYADRTCFDVNFLGGDYPFGAALASDGKGKVAIACLDQGGDVYVVESLDHGVTWPDSITNITQFGPGLEDGFGSDEVARPDRFMDALYDKDGQLHVVWEGSYFMDTTQKDERHPWTGYGADLPYLSDYKPCIGHWSKNTGVTTAAVSTSPTEDLNGVYRLITGRSRGCLTSSPSIAYDSENDIIYVGYTQYDELHGELMAPEVDPYGENVQRFVGYGELYIVASGDHGATWSSPENVTETPEFDERCFVLNDQVIDGNLHAFYVGDNQPGYEFYAYFPPVVSAVYYYAIDVSQIPVTAVKTHQIARQFELSPLYPNPFNPTANIRFSLSKTGNVKLSIYNALGQKVKTLIDKPMNAGRYDAIWNGTDDYSALVSSGVYLCRLDTDFGTMMRKITFIK